MSSCELNACDGTGWILNTVRNVIYPCECQEVRRIKQLFVDAKIPQRYLTASLETLLPSLLTLVKDFAEKAAPGREPSALVLTGGIGVGKTYAAYAVVKALLARGYHALTESVPDLLEALRANQLDEVGAQRLRLAQTVDVLLLDDLAAHRQTEFVLERLFMIINTRYNELLPTIVTMNADFAQVMKDAGTAAQAWDRLFSRLREMAGKIHRINGVDMRVRP